jgi:hypothetical protein
MNTYPASVMQRLFKFADLPASLPGYDPDTGVAPTPELRALGELVGDYSEAIIQCSYNEADVLLMLLGGALDGPEAEQLLQAIEAAGGWWPKSYTEPVPVYRYAAALLQADD